MIGGLGAEKGCGPPQDPNLTDGAMWQWVYDLALGTLAAPLSRGFLSTVRSRMVTR